MKPPKPNMTLMEVFAEEERRNREAKASQQTMKTKAPAYTLKHDGRYFTGRPTGTTFSYGFTAVGISGCYSYPLEEAREMQREHGGEIVEVVDGSMPFERKEGKTIR